MKKFILYFVLLIIGNVAFAQQLPQFSSYQLSPFLYNPAYAGVDGTTQLNAVFVTNGRVLEKLHKQTLSTVMVCYVTKKWQLVLQLSKM